MADTDTLQPQPQKHYVAKLMQTTEICTEQFTELDGNALTGDPEAIKSAVEEHLDKERDLSGEYRVVVEEIVEQAPERTIISSDGEVSTVSSAEGESPA